MVTISARLPEELVKAIDEERKSWKFVPSRTEVLEQVLRDWVESCRKQRSGAPHVR